MADKLKDVNHIHPLEDFIQRGIDYLPGDFLKEKENLVKFLEIYLERWKAVDEMLVDLSEKRLLNIAEGDHLDEIGRQFGIPRNGLSDNNYRALLIILNSSSGKHGTRPEIIGILKSLLGDGNFTTYKGDNYRFDINIYDSCFDVNSLLDQIIDMMPLVTDLRIIESSVLPFGFSGDDRSAGFGSSLNEGIQEERVLYTMSGEKILIEFPENDLSPVRLTSRRAMEKKKNKVARKVESSQNGGMAKLLHPITNKNKSVPLN